VNQEESMKTMIWKELRENVRWALLAGFVLLMAEIYALTMERSALGGSWASVTLCGDTFLMVSAFGCSAVGAVLGALQILPELRRDQWASLLHRPVPREQILAGKMVAGLVLYAAAVCIPLVVSVIFVIWPGAFPAPFVPGLTIPALSDLLLGLIFYVGALLIGLHPGRWIGTRGAMVLAAIGILLIHLNDGWPFVLPVIALIVFFVAAWGAMGHPLARRPLLSRLAFGAVILTGIEAALVPVGIGLRDIPLNETFGYFFTDFYIASDGAVFLQKQDGKGGSQLTDVDGKVVTDEKYVGNSAGFSLFPDYMADRRTPQRGRFLRVDRSSRNRVEMIQSNFTSPDLWYRVYGKAPYFIGYNSLNKRSVGFFDREGFKRPGAIRQPFASMPEGLPMRMNPHLYWIGPQILAFDFSDRTMTPFVNVGSDRIYGLQKFPNMSEHQRIAVALSSEIRIYDTKGALLFSIPYAYPAEGWPDIGITATEDFSRIFIQYSNYWVDAPPVVHLDALDGQGQRVATYTSPRRDIFPLRQTWNERLADLLKAPIPSALLSAWNAHRQSKVDVDYAAGIPASLLPQFERVMERGELAVLGGWTLVLCAIAVVWARKAGLSTARIIRWIALTAIFGVGGLLAYRLSTDWPVRVRCPRCAHRRPIGEGTCPNCQAPWEAPATNGTEIFEPA
jgi:hypothetical protein